MGELVSEKGAELEVVLAAIGAPDLGRSVFRPHLGRHGVRGRAHGEDQQGHPLHVAVPVVGDEPVLGRPAHADPVCPDQGPGPFDAVVEAVCKLADLRFLRVGILEIGLAGERPRHQDRGIDGGQLDLLKTFSCFHVEKMIEESFIPGRALRIRALRRLIEEPQGPQNPVGGLGARDIAPLRPDDVGRQSESHR